MLCQGLYSEGRGGDNNSNLKHVKKKETITMGEEGDYKTTKDCICK